MTREEHLAWAKSRAHEYLSADDPEQAVASMMSDLGKHEAWRDFPAMPMLAMGALLAGTVKAARDFVEGFN